MDESLPEQNLVGILLLTRFLIFSRDARLRPRGRLKVRLHEINLPTYFSQQDPEPHMITNQQIQTLADSNLIQPHWLKGEEHHLLESIILPTTPHAPLTKPQELYTLIDRIPISNQRSQLETRPISLTHS